jgi:MoaA/NifB/PqqE/SkfB family radical SAM enzyme
MTRDARILTNLTCNQNCVYCNARAAADGPAFARRAVRAAITRALAAGARAITFTGGEPTLRRDLLELIAAARTGGARSVVLETNATLIDARGAARLRAAGVDRVRVNLAGGGDELDAVTRDPGGFRRSMAGLRALVDAGLPVEVSAAIVGPTRTLVAALPAALRAALGAGRRIAGLVARVPADGPRGAPLLDLAAAAAAVRSLERAAKVGGVEVWLDVETAPPPCVFSAGARPAHLFRLTRAGGGRTGYVRVPACEPCLSRDACPGFHPGYLARGPTPRLAPITTDRARRRLMLRGGSVAEIVARDLVTIDRPRTATRGFVEEHVIRVSFRCNQSCSFCFVSTHLPDPPPAAVHAVIAAAQARRANIVLSGGEPTLNPRLSEYVRLASRGAVAPVVVQTNATRLSDAVVRELVAAGLGGAFVSLHADTAAISDAITGSPGSFARTVAGLDALVRAGVPTVINFVICQRNLGRLVPFARLVSKRWPRASLNVSFVAASAEVVPRTRAQVPRYSEVLPELAAVLVEARARGLRLVGFESLCGVPLCLAPGELGRFLELCDIDDELVRDECVRAPACGDCGLAGKCYGVRRSYAELYGLDEVRPRAAPAGERPAPGEE